MTFIDGLNPNEPSDTDRVREAAAKVRDVKDSLQGSFPDYDSALDIGPIALNGYEGRIAALEASFASVAARRIESGRIKTAGVGDSTVTGLLFQPSLLMISTQNSEGAFGFQGPSVSVGFADGTSQFCITTVTDGPQRAGGDRTDFSSTLLWNVYTGEANLAATGTLVSFNSDGFTVNESLGLNSITLIWTAFE